MLNLVRGSRSFQGNNATDLHLETGVDRNLTPHCCVSNTQATCGVRTIFGCCDTRDASLSWWTSQSRCVCVCCEAQMDQGWDSEHFLEQCFCMNNKSTENIFVHLRWQTLSLKSMMMQLAFPSLLIHEQKIFWCEPIWFAIFNWSVHIHFAVAQSIFHCTLFPMQLCEQSSKSVEFCDLLLQSELFPKARLCWLVKFQLPEVQCLDQLRWMHLHFRKACTHTVTQPWEQLFVDKNFWVFCAHTAWHAIAILLHFLSDSEFLFETKINKTFTVLILLFQTLIPSLSRIANVHSFTHCCGLECFHSPTQWNLFICTPSLKLSMFEALMNCEALVWGIWECMFVLLAQCAMISILFLHALWPWHSANELKFVFATICACIFVLPFQASTVVFLCLQKQMCCAAGLTRVRVRESRESRRVMDVTRQTWVGTRSLPCYAVISTQHCLIRSLQRMKFWIEDR